MENKEEYVQKLFSRIAGDYDKLNDMMTLSLHHGWKKQMIRICHEHMPSSEAKILDLCTGTGDLAFKWAEYTDVLEVIGLDYCQPMLNTAEQRLAKCKEESIRDKIKFIQGDALQLPFEDNSFDALTVGFGLRNVKDLNAVLKEIKRVLKPGALFASLDLGHPPRPAVNIIYQFIFGTAIPWLGERFAKDKAAYQYLVDSLETWPTQEELSYRCWDLGFKRSYYHDLALGSIAIVVAEK